MFITLLNKFSLHKKSDQSESDTIFFSFADHGLIDVKYFDICEHEDLHSLLSQDMSFEKRVANFFVKTDKKKEFQDLFNKYYGQYFELMDRNCLQR
ncbi:MAG: hypothetical protein H6688_00965 [Erysipelotrichaceae bacterium]|nr:hypothetical protein [Erysipelotrichaceae bacterium]